MKKILMMAATAALVLSSCSKNEIKPAPEQGAGDAIAFGTYLGQATKAESEEDFAVGDIMSVDGYYLSGGGNSFGDADPTQIMDGIAVSKRGEGDWVYDDVLFWSNETDKYSFFATTFAASQVTGAGLANVTAAGGKVSFDYENPKTAEGQKDLMAASELNRVKTEGKIQFNFKHLLSQIRFTFATKHDYGDNATVTLTGLTVTYGDGFAAEGTYTFDNATESSGEWDLDGSTVDQATEVIGGADVTTKTQVLTSTATAYSHLRNIMVLPQNEELKVTVYYTVTIEAVNGDILYNEDKRYFTTASSITPIAGFEGSTIYTYPVTISLENDAIIFGEPNIVEWDEEGGSEITNPIN